MITLDNSDGQDHHPTALMAKPKLYFEPAPEDSPTSRDVHKSMIAMIFEDLAKVPRIRIPKRKIKNLMALRASLSKKAKQIGLPVETGTDEKFIYIGRRRA